MATELKTDYKDDVLNTEVNTNRKYRMIDNGDGTVSFEDVTEYTQEGDGYGATQINEQNELINELNSDISKQYKDLSPKKIDITYSNACDRKEVRVFQIGKLVNISGFVTATPSTNLVLFSGLPKPSSSQFGFEGGTKSITAVMSTGDFIISSAGSTTKSYIITDLTYMID